MLQFANIRTKLLYSFALLLLLTISVILIDLSFRNAERRIEASLGQLNFIQLTQKSIHEAEKTFLLDDVINEEFYKNRTCQTIEAQKKLTAKLKNTLETLRTQNLSEALAKDIEAYIKAQAQHDLIFQELITQILNKGFKDYGLEGEMRKLIHDLENSALAADKVSLLTIRRHEKDFLLRKQISYIEKHKEAVETLKLRLSGQEDLLGMLSKYQEVFTSLASVDQQIGFDNTKGLRGKLTTNAAEIDQIAAKIATAFTTRSENLRWQNALYQFGLIGVCIGLIVWLTLSVSRQIGKPIHKISTAIHEIIASNFTAHRSIPVISSNDELGKLSKDIDHLVTTVKNNITVLQEKTEEIEKKQQALDDSIVYAQRMQQSLLVEQKLDEHFKNHFLIYLPKYEVSGDLYWHKKIEDTHFCAVLDCKGIGLAGSIMTVLANAMLNQIVFNEFVRDPAEILNNLHRKMRTILPQGHTAIGICKIEPAPTFKYNRVTFAGAGLSLHHSKGILLQTIEGSKHFVGAQLQSNFVNTQVELHKSEILYLCSDGLAKQPKASDQPYAEAGLKNLLEQNLYKPLSEQKQFVEAEIQQLFQQRKQKDDITLWGFMISATEYPQLVEENQSPLLTKV